MDFAYGIALTLELDFAYLQAILHWSFYLKLKYNRLDVQRH